jgi:hypothetical protein
MLTPVDTNYRRMLENRVPSLSSSRRYKSDVFLQSTKYALQDFLKLVISMESKIELLRQRLNRMVRFNVRTMFERVDRLGKGSIIDTDVNYLKLNFFIFFCLIKNF